MWLILLNNGISDMDNPLLLDALQALLQKMDLQRLLADLTFQFCNPAFRPAPVAIAAKGVSRRLPELPPPAMQHVRAYLQRPRDLADRNSSFQPRNSSELELFRELPERQSDDTILRSMDFVP